MMKVSNSFTKRIFLIAFTKAGFPGECFTKVKATSYSISRSLSSNSQGVHRNLDSNKIDAPFAGTEPKISRKIIVEDHDEPYSSRSTEGEEKKSNTEDVTDYVADKTKSGAKSAMETAFDVGAAMAEGMEKSWGGVKETTQKIKDSVLGDNNEKQDEHYYGGRKGRDGDYEKVDKHVEDLRKKAAGFHDSRPK